MTTKPESDTVGGISAIIQHKMPAAKPEEFIRYGYSTKGAPIYLHKPTGKRFVANGALPGRRIPPEQVGDAVGMFYEGLSTEQIRRNFGQKHGFYPSTATVYEWIVDYTNLAKDRMRQFKAHTGETWVCDEMVLKVGGKKYWNWNVMDADTRFLLATRLSATRGSRDAELVLKKARLVAARRPRFVVSDRLSSYVDGVERAFGAGVHHIPADGIRAEVNNNLSERLQGTIRARSKVMRGLKSQRTAQLILDGWTIHYNYFRPHESLGRDRTPALAAGIEAPYENWLQIAHQDVRPFSRKRGVFERERVLKNRLLGKQRPSERMPKIYLFRTRRGGL